MRKGIAENLIAWGVIVVGGWWFHHASVLSDVWTVLLGLGLALVATGLIFRFGGLQKRIPKSDATDAAPPDYATITRGRGRTTIKKSRLAGRATYTDDDGTTEIEDSDLGRQK